MPRYAFGQFSRPCACPAAKRPDQGSGSGASLHGGSESYRVDILLMKIEGVAGARPICAHPQGPESSAQQGGRPASRQRRNSRRGGAAAAAEPRGKSNPHRSVSRLFLVSKCSDSIPGHQGGGHRPNHSATSSRKMRQWRYHPGVSRPHIISAFLRCRFAPNWPPATALRTCTLFAAGVDQI